MISARTSITASIQRAVIVCDEPLIKVEDLGLNAYGTRIEVKALDPEKSALPTAQDREIVPLDEFERRYICQVLKATHYQIKGTKGAAALLGLPPSTLAE